MQARFINPCHSQSVESLFSLPSLGRELAKPSPTLKRDLDAQNPGLRTPPHSQNRSYWMIQKKYHKGLATQKPVRAPKSVDEKYYKLQVKRSFYKQITPDVMFYFSETGYFSMRKTSCRLVTLMKKPNFALDSAIQWEKRGEMSRN